MEEEIVYPVIKTVEVSEMVKNKINKDLNIERLNHMIKEENFLQDLLLRYQRVKKSWGKADSIVKNFWCYYCYFRWCCINSCNVFRSWNNYCKWYVNSPKYINWSRKLKRFYNYNIKYEMNKTKKERISRKNKIN